MRCFSLWKNVDVIRDKDWKGSSLVALVETACTACFFHDTFAETQQTTKDCFFYTRWQQHLRRFYRRAQTRACVGRRAPQNHHHRPRELRPSKRIIIV